MGETQEPGRIRPKGRQLWGLHRHKCGQIANSPIYLEVTPDAEHVPDALAAAWKHKIEHYLADPSNMYQDVRDIMVSGALAARLWAYEILYSHETRKIEFIPRDGRRVRWAEGYFNPHQRLCPWFYYWETMDVDEIAGKKGWKNNKDLQGDKAVGTSTSSKYAPGLVDLTPDHAPKLEESGLRKRSTVVFLWRRVFGTATAPVKDTFVPLPPDEQYMGCMQPDFTGCGYASDTLGDMQEDNAVPPGWVDPTTKALVDVAPSPCPQCGAQLQAVRSTEVQAERNSRLHLTIFAPFEGSDGLVLYEGFDPYGLPTYPFCVFRAYVNPIKPMGQSETSVNMSYQTLVNMLDRIAVENIMLAKPFFGFPDSARDVRGEPWEMRTDQGLMFTFNSLIPSTHQPMILQAQGSPAALSQVRGALDNALRADLGTNDLTFAPDQSRDIPVGTISAIERQGEVPVQHQIKWLQRAESHAMTVLLYMLRATELEEAPYAAKGTDGSREVHSIAAVDLPLMSVVVTADPSTLVITGDEAAKLQQIASTPRPQRRFMARRLNIPMAEILQLEKDEDAEFERQLQMQQAQQQATAPPMIPGAPGAVQAAQSRGQAGGGAPPIPPGIAARGGMAPAVNGAGR